METIALKIIKSLYVEQNNSDGIVEELPPSGDCKSKDKDVRIKGNGSSESPARDLMYGEIPFQNPMVPVCCLFASGCPYHDPATLPNTFHQRWIPAGLVARSANHPCDKTKNRLPSIHLNCPGNSPSWICEDAQK